MSIEIMKQALEAMEYADACLKKQLTTKTKHEYAQDLLMDAGVALRQAIEQAEKQETHSWYSAEHDEWMTNKTRKEHEALNSYTHKVGGFDLPLYTTPQPQREWVGLTDEEVDYIADEYSTLQGAIRAIEAKLRSKNT